jgi:membrane-bound ClpP family serine protease
VFVPGVILLVIGAVCLAVYWMGVPEPALRIAGVILVIVGAVLVLLDVLDSSDVEHAGFIVPGFVGMTAVPPSHPRRSPQEAPTPPTAPTLETSWAPTNKLAAAITAAILYGLSLLTDVDPQLEQAVNVLGALVAGWLMRNQKTPGGVPLKK